MIVQTVLLRVSVYTPGRFAIGLTRSPYHWKLFGLWFDIIREGRLTPVPFLGGGAVGVEGCQIYPGMCGAGLASVYIKPERLSVPALLSDPQGLPACSPSALDDLCTRLLPKRWPRSSR